ncbi:MAG: DUF4258 domain-containing protein [Acidobacteria bacterium]|nr:DUF4258 domain-containing protein [Acidobacteriota bacterium]
MNPSVRALTPAEARETIQHLLKTGSDAISFVRHAHERARERNFNRRDVEHVLRTGRVGDSSWDERFGNWKYPVSGTDLDGDDLTVIIALDRAWARITVITGF